MSNKSIIHQKSTKKKNKTKSPKKKKNTYSFLNFSNAGGFMNGRSSGASNTIIAPAASGKVLTTIIPRFSSSNGNCVISHSEYLQDIVQAVTFDKQGVEINPGLPETFPWLSRISNSFERYRFRFLRFRYEVLSSSTTQGKIFFVPDFNMEEEGPLDKLEALSYELAIGAQPWCRFDHVIPNKYLHTYNEYFIRSGSIDSDIKTYDALKLWVCTEGAVVLDQASKGELWIDYEIELMNPLGISHLITPSDLYRNCWYYVCESGFSGTTNTPFGNSSIATPEGGLDISVSDSTLTFNRDGYSIINIYWGFNTTAMTGDVSDYINWPAGPTSQLTTTGCTTTFAQYTTLVEDVTSQQRYIATDVYVIYKAGATITATVDKRTGSTPWLNYVSVSISPYWNSTSKPVIPTLEKVKKLCSFEQSNTIRGSLESEKSEVKIIKKK